MSYEIYNEDCLEGMKSLADNSVDLIATGPPYCVGASSNGIKSSFSDFNLMRPFFEELFSQWQRVLKDGGHAYCCTDWRTYPFLYPLIIKYLMVRNLIVWDYGWIKTGIFYRSTYELVIFATKGKSTRQFSCAESDVWRIRCVNFTNSSKLHQAQKPVELMEKMIRNSSAEGGTVLDPFLGSGTTAIAAMNLNRNFIGYEIDERYFEIAQKRIGDALALKQQELFSLEA